MTHTTISKIFFSSLTLFLCSPFFTLGGFYFPYSVGHVVAWAFGMLGMLISTTICIKKDEHFKKNVFDLAQHPVIAVYALFILWIMVRSIFAGSTANDLWWGSLQRTDGLFFHISWLIGMVCMAAWLHDVFFVKSERKILAVIALATIFSAAIFQQIGLDLLVSPIAPGRLAGTVGNPLYLAGILLFVPWFALRVQNNYIFVISTLTAAVLIYKTDARGAFLAAIVGGLVYLWGLESKKISYRTKIIIIGALFVAGAASAGFVVLRKISLPRMSTVTTRLMLWKSAVPTLKQHPFFGLGVTEARNEIDRLNNSVTVISYTEIFDSTHSVFVDLALKGGLIALLLLSMWGIIVYRTLKTSLARGTFVALFVLFATTPFMVWTLVPLCYMIACSLDPKSNAKMHERILFPGWVIIAGIVVISCAVIIITLPYNARLLFQAQQVSVRGAFTKIPTNGPLITPRWLPFSADIAVELFRVSMPPLDVGLAPSYDRYLREIVIPVFNVFATRVASPDQYFVAATWANTYASSGLTPNNLVWFEQSRLMQEKALAINPDRAAALFQLADSLRELGKIQDALVLLKNFADRQPDLGEAQVNYALMLDISGDTKQSFALEQQIKKTFPNHDWSEDFQRWFTSIEKRGEALTQVPSK
ncbi:MAG: tetratricopeptide repeat protein [Candidatus Magasanikbacteria bacterium]|nr:tetratricopeptide repeat protein [Candidatus Magasanikbacteria bacterium]